MASSAALKRFASLFPRLRTNVVGMVHLGALPGTPRSSLSMGELIERAVTETKIYASFGLDGIIVENMSDIPYVPPNRITPEIPACAAVLCHEVRRHWPIDKPMGVQILAGGNQEALAVGLASGAQFIRAEGFVFSHVADEGWIDGCAGQLLRYRRHLGADESVSVFCDIKKKHSSHAITADISLAQTAEAAAFFLADGVILTGSKTGEQTSVADLAEVVAGAPQTPVLIGSGLTTRNVASYAQANALIVGSYFKRDGYWENQIDSKRIEDFMNQVETLR